MLLLNSLVLKMLPLLTLFSVLLIQTESLFVVKSFHVQSFFLCLMFWLLHKVWRFVSKWWGSFLIKLTSCWSLSSQINTASILKVVSWITASVSNLSLSIVRLVNFLASFSISLLCVRRLPHRFCHSFGWCLIIVLLFRLGFFWFLIWAVFTWATAPIIILILPRVLWPRSFIICLIVSIWWLWCLLIWQFIPRLLVAILAWHWSIIHVAPLIVVHLLLFNKEVVINLKE